MYFFLSARVRECLSIGIVELTNVSNKLKYEADFSVECLSVRVSQKKLEIVLARCTTVYTKEKKQRKKCRQKEEYKRLITTEKR